MDGRFSQAVLTCGTWNVRGLTDLKLFELILHMRRYNIGILCMQETWKTKAAAYDYQGFQVILSGPDQTNRCWAGVGFIVAPWLRRRVKSYQQTSERMAQIKLAVRGGTIGIISAYAPHNLKPLAERADFLLPA